MGEGPAAGHSDGVDRSQIRRLLALTPLERIRHMVDVANGMARFRDLVGRAERGIFEPEPLLHVLNRHGVGYVVVGGLAAVAHGSPLPTEDVEITPTCDRANLDRLGNALHDVGVEFPCDGAFLAAQPTMLNLVSDLGDIDLTIAPTGFPRGYDDLIDDAIGVDLGDGVMTRIASLDDVISSKRAAGRDKDLAALPYLEALREEVERRDA
jgi:hypothetical protein